MLYGYNSKSKVGDADPFNKKKLADEAKRDHQNWQEAQKQVERNKLQLQIDNRKRELDKLEVDLHTKESSLSGSNKKIEDIKRAIFLLESQIKKQEGGIGYINDEAKSKERQIASKEVELASLSSKKDTLAAEINKIKKEISDRENMLREKIALNEKLEQEYEALEISSKQSDAEKTRVSKDAQAEEKQIKGEKQELLLKKRILEQVERDISVLTQEVAKINRDKTSKQREMDDLKRKRDAVK